MVGVGLPEAPYALGGVQRGERRKGACPPSRSAAPEREFWKTQMMRHSEGGVLCDRCLSDSRDADRSRARHEVP